MTISTVESLKVSIASLFTAGVKPEHIIQTSPTCVVAAVNVNLDNLPMLEKSLSDVDVEVLQRYPINRTVDVKLSLNIEDDWLLQSVVNQEIPTISIKL